MKYRKKPIVIEAVRFYGDSTRLPTWASDAVVSSTTNGLDCTLSFCHVGTLEGDMRCAYGDWLIQGIKGEVYPCKSDIFEATYDAVEVVPKDGCGRCGKPLPPGEEMFKYHGYSGPCPEVSE